MLVGGGGNGGSMKEYSDVLSDSGWFCKLDNASEDSDVGEEWLDDSSPGYVIAPGVIVSALGREVKWPRTRG